MSAASAILGIETLATEAQPERLSVSFLREAEYLPLICRRGRRCVATLAPGQANAKGMECPILGAAAFVGRNRD
jgi:hypothetical protein